MRTHRLLIALLAFAVAAFGQDKDKNDKTKDKDHHSVRVETGGKTYGVSSDKLDEKQLGIPIYPGARVKPQSDNSKEGANLSLDMGDDSLRVLAQSYVSDDPPDRIASFYKQRLAKFGPVLECRDGHAVGDLKTTNGLKCDNDDGKDGGIELKAGSERDQHVVGVKPASNGTEFGVAVVKQKKRASM